ncbi:MAG: OmpL47-type beta-barrel domain-containing protein, partial [Nocardioidaceae bacterium]
MTTRVVLTTLVACLLALGLARSAVALPATAIVLRPASVTVPVGAAVTFQAFQCSVDSFGNPQVGPDGVPGTRDDACTPGIFGWSTTIGRLLGTSGPTVGLVADAPGSGEVTASLLGLEGTALVTVVGGDTIPPTTTAAADPAPNAKGWNPTNVTVTLNAVDNPGGSGVKEIHYAAEGVIGPTTVPGSTASFTVTDEGVTTVTYFAVDNAGNEEAERTLELKIDKTNPTIDGGRTPLPNENGWNNTDVTVFVQASDEHGGSGIEKFFLSVIGENEVLLLTVGGNTGSVTLTKETN